MMTSNYRDIEAFCIPRNATKRTAKGLRKCTINHLKWFKANANQWHAQVTDRLSASLNMSDGAWTVKIHVNGNAKGIPVRDPSTGLVARHKNMNAASQAAYTAMNSRTYLEA